MLLLRLQESYDNAGLIVGRPEDEVHQALLAVDVTEEVLDEGAIDGVRSDSHAPSDRFPCPQAVQFGLLCGAVRRAGDPPGNSALRLSYQPGQCAGRA